VSLQTPAPSRYYSAGAADTDLGLWCGASPTSHGIDEKAGAGVAEVDSLGGGGKGGAGHCEAL